MAAFLILIVLGCMIWGAIINRPVNEVGIEGSSVHFKTPGFLLPLVKGKPDETVRSSEFGTTQYIYQNQTLFQQTGVIYYNCTFGVYEVGVVIPVDKQNGEEIYHYIDEYVCNVYSKKNGFYDEGIVAHDETGELSHSFGADFGATGISVWVEYADDQISVRANYQY